MAFTTPSQLTVYLQGNRQVVVDISTATPRTYFNVPAQPESGRFSYGKTATFLVAGKQMSLTTPISFDAEQNYVIETRPEVCVVYRNGTPFIEALPRASTISAVPAENGSRADLVFWLNGWFYTADLKEVDSWAQLREERYVAGSNAASI